jgi:acetyl-CoA carboxylase biotin carboxyl carrier protein
VDLNELKQLVAWLEASDLRSLELSRPGEYLKLTVSGNNQAVVIAAEGVTDASALPEGGCGESAEMTVHTESAGVFVATHPMRSAPFAKVGDFVKKNDILGLLKIRHIYAPITAPVDGVVTQIVATDGVLVGFGAPVLRIDPTLEVTGD